MQKQVKFIKTNEDWYPTYKNGTIRVFCCALSNGLFRVAVWGNDDFGLEADVKEANLAQTLYDEIKDFTTQSELKFAGFIQA